METKPSAARFFGDIVDRARYLPVAGWAVFSWGTVVYPSAIAETTGYDIDCSVPLLNISQYVLGLMSVLFGYRVFRAVG
jgi:hypothetical protein